MTEPTTVMRGAGTRQSVDPGDRLKPVTGSRRAGLRGERAEVVDGRAEQRVAQVEQARPERGAVGRSCRGARRRRGPRAPARAPRARGRRRRRGSGRRGRRRDRGSGATRRALRRPGPPYQERPSARSGSSSSRYRESGALEARKRRLDAVGRVPERRLACTRGRGHGLAAVPALEQAAERERRRLARAQLLRQAARRPIGGRVLADHLAPAGLRRCHRHQTAHTSITTGRIIGRRRVRE